MDAPVVEIAAPAAREVLRDNRGTIIGTVEPQLLTGKLVARDARGRVIGRGNLLGALLLRGR